MVEKKRDVEKKMSDMINFRGIILYRNEADLIEKLEKEIKQNLVYLSTLLIIENGYYIKNGHISEIRLNNCNLEVLPNYISKFRFLEVLECSDNNLLDLPNELEDLNFLEVLNLHKNIFKDIPICIQGYIQIKKINLNDNLIESLPVWLKSFHLIEIFECENNKISDIDEDFFEKWNNLKILNLNSNLLSTIPISLLKCSELMIFTIENNKIMKLFNNWERFKKLEKIDIHKNKIDTFPQSIYSLSNLRSLDFSHNLLNNLPECNSSCFFLEKLENFELQFNYLKNIPSCFKYLKRLSSLKLNNNLLTSFPNFLFEIYEIKNINLSNNLIENIPESINLLIRSNCQIDLQENPIKKISFILQNCWDKITINDEIKQNFLQDPIYQEYQKKISIFIDNNIVNFELNSSEFRPIINREKIIDLPIDNNVQFDYENCEIEDFFLYQKKFHYLIARVGGDWQFPLYISIYRSKKGKFRVYIPNKGNVYNKDTNHAIGDDIDADYNYLKSIGYELGSPKNESEIKSIVKNADVLKKMIDLEAIHEEIHKLFK